MKTKGESWNSKEYSDSYELIMVIRSEEEGRPGFCANFPLSSMITPVSVLCLKEMRKEHDWFNTSSQGGSSLCIQWDVCAPVKQPRKSQKHTSDMS